MQTKQAILDVKNLVKTFTTTGFLTKKTHVFTAVNSVSFELGASEILGLLGPNGAGKTTIVQMLLSILIPTDGTITYFERDFYKHRSEILQQIAFASTYVKLPGRLTVQENLDIYGRLYGMSSKNRQEAIKKYLTFFGLWHARDKETGVLSAGQTTCVMLVKAFMTNPKIVLLDEPTASLDPDIAHLVREFIVRQQQELGVSILVTSHNMEEVTQICDRVLVLKQGTIIANNTPEQLAASVASTRIHITTDTIPALTQYAHEHKLIYTLEKNGLSIEIDDHAIANLLNSLTRNNIYYSHISIDKPTLEDYFLHIAKESI
jgi:ABC-2 type transport system ATP-binding protein